MNAPKVDKVLAHSVATLTPAELLDRAAHHDRWAKQCRTLARYMIERDTDTVDVVPLPKTTKGGAQ